MHEILQEITNTPRRDVRIDRDSGVLYGVKIIGCRSRNGREYPSETLREAIALYENSKVNLDHPEGDPRKPRSYQDRFGVLRNVTLREDDGLFADFRFNPKHAVAEQLLWDAEHAPENVGFSHNVEAIVRRDADRVIVEKIVAVRSVDLVADPATTSGLFESVESGDEENSETENIPRDVDDEKTSEGNSSSESDRNGGLALLCRALLSEIRKFFPEWAKFLDESFLETLDSISEPGLQKRFVDDRIQLLEQCSFQITEERKPVSREQFVPEIPVDVKSFVRLIKK